MIVLKVILKEYGSITKLKLEEEQDKSTINEINTMINLKNAILKFLNENSIENKKRERNDKNG